MTYSGFFDPSVSDREVCFRIWHMVARRNGFSTTVVDSLEGDDMGGRKRTPEETQEIVRRLKAGEHPKKIADEVDRVETFIRSVARDEGIELPSRRGSNGRADAPEPEPPKRKKRAVAAATSTALAVLATAQAEERLGTMHERLRGEACRLREAADALDHAADVLR